MIVIILCLLVSKESGENLCRLLFINFRRTSNGRLIQFHWNRIIHQLKGNKYFIKLRQVMHQRINRRVSVEYFNQLVI